MSRLFIFLTFLLGHLALYFLQLESLAPLLAGSVYLPLMAFKAIGMPVLAAGNGGWAAPSLLGWAMCFFCWAAIWWFVSGWLARFAASRRNQA